MQSDLRSLRIVVADDNVDAARALTVLLEMCGHRVFTAFDGEVAERTAIEQQPDLGIFDIGMPKKNGYQVAQAVRLACPRATLVAVSGWGNVNDVERAYAAGFHHHFTKPADFKDIESVIRHLLPSGVV